MSSRKSPYEELGIHPAPKFDRRKKEKEEKRFRRFLEAKSPRLPPGDSEKNPFRQIREKKGDENEERVGRALEVLLRSGWIKSYARTEKGSPLDLFGVDYQVVDTWGKTHDVQVKSSWQKLFSHYMRFPKIVCVVANSRTDTEYLAMVIRKELRLPPPTKAPMEQRILLA